MKPVSYINTLSPGRTIVLTRAASHAPCARRGVNDDRTGALEDRLDAVEHPHPARDDMAVIDHRGGVRKLGRRVLDGIKTIFKCAGPVIIYPASGTAAWEAALVNTMSPATRC